MERFREHLDKEPLTDDDLGDAERAGNLRAEIEFAGFVNGEQ